MKISNKVLAVSGVVVFALPLLALALPTPTVPVSGTTVTGGSVADLIQSIATWLITVSVVIAVIVIIWGGIKYMFAKGEDNAIAAAWNMIKNGVIGAAIVLGVGVILRTVANLVSQGGNIF